MSKQDTHDSSSLSSSYPYRLVEDIEQGGYSADHPDLEGCIAQGDTAEEAIANLDVARELWLETRLEDGLPIPPLLSDEAYSGRVSLRIPVPVHARLTRHAESCGLSLNKLLNRILSDSVAGLGPVHGQGTPSALAVARTLEDFLALNYPYELTRDDQEGGYFAEHPDLPGCAAQGETAKEAIDSLNEARKLWIETRLEDGLPVPEPLSEEAGGLISLRMSPILHADLVKHAARNQVSLNLWLNTVLAEFAGSLAAGAPAKVYPPFERGGLTDKEMATVAACLFHGGEVQLAEKILAAWSQKHADFLLGLLYLKAGEGQKAIYRFSSAYTKGLDFDTEGTEIYLSISGQITLRALHESLLPFFHAIDKDSEMGRVGAEVVDWIGNRKKEPQEEPRPYEPTHSRMGGR
jgi:predicted RNase H-like HicB family nuclease